MGHNLQFGLDTTPIWADTRSLYVWESLKAEKEYPGRVDVDSGSEGGVSFFQPKVRYVT